MKTITLADFYNSNNNDNKSKPSGLKSGMIFNAKAQLNNFGTITLTGQRNPNIAYDQYKLRLNTSNGYLQIADSTSSTRLSSPVTGHLVNRAQFSTAPDTNSNPWSKYWAFISVPAARANAYSSGSHINKWVKIQTLIVDFNWDGRTDSTSNLSFAANIYIMKHRTNPSNINNRSLTIYTEGVANGYTTSDLLIPPTHVGTVAHNYTVASAFNLVNQSEITAARSDIRSTNVRPGPMYPELRISRTHIEVGQGPRGNTLAPLDEATFLGMGTTTSYFPSGSGKIRKQWQTDTSVPIWVYIKRTNSPSSYLYDDAGNLPVNTWVALSSIDRVFSIKHATMSSTTPAIGVILEFDVWVSTSGTALAPGANGAVGHHKISFGALSFDIPRPLGKNSTGGGGGSLEDGGIYYDRR